MAKDNEENTELGQDEYQYTDPDSTETYVEPEPPGEIPATAAPRMVDDKRKRIIIILVVLGLLFVVFQFVKAKNKTSKTTEVAAPISNIDKQMAAQPQAAEQPAPVVPAAMQTGGDASKLSVADTSALNSPPPEDATHKVTDQSEQDRVQIQQLQTSMEQLQANVNQLTEAVNALQTKVPGVISKRERTGPVQKKISRPQREKAYKIGMHGKANVYYIKAVVPRRAWLQSWRGNEITVKEGDNIPGYGTVQSIDANDGIVVTSSNKVIRFSSNDN